MRVIANVLRRIGAIGFVPIIALIAVVPMPKSWFYRNSRPTRLGRGINRCWTSAAAAGLTPYSWPGKPRGGTVALETTGRRSGRTRENVLTWVEHSGQRYFVSMLSDRVDWVRNVRAARGQAAIRHGGRQAVRLEEVPLEQRAPILRDYLRRTRISTQEHLGGLDPDAPLEEFGRIADRHPVFRIVEGTS